MLQSSATQLIGGAGVGHGSLLVHEYTPSVVLGHDGAVPWTERCESVIKTQLQREKSNTSPGFSTRLHADVWAPVQCETFVQWGHAALGLAR